MKTISIPKYDKLTSLENIQNVINLIADKENGPKQNLNYLAKVLEDDCKSIDYLTFCRHFLAKSKQIKSGIKLLKMGNDKLHKSIGIFNMPAVFSCPNCKDCKNTCYAYGPQNRYPSCRVSRFVNSLIVRYYKLNFIGSVIWQIEKYKIKTVRIHESGDFYSADYAGLWYEIAKRSTGCKFYYYTKTDKNTAILDTLTNTNKVKSILPDGSLNYGSLEYVMDKSAKLNVDICPVTNGHKDIRCGLTCKKCHDSEYMLFVIHKG